MKIRNKHDGTTIESQWMKEERLDFFLRIIEDNFLFDEAIYYKENGWEEVTDTNVGHKWHDLRKNPDDLPNLSRYNFALDYKYCFLIDGGYSMLRYSKDGKWYFGLANDRPYCGVIAWRDLPKFNED